MQSNCAVDLDYLHMETERLRMEVAELQRQLVALDAPATVDEWDIWPYSWCRAAWHRGCLCFHSFHGILRYRYLALRNRKVIARIAQRPGGEQALRLVCREG